VEDLYFTHMGFDFGGDSRMAAKVAEKMMNVDYVGHAAAIMQLWLKREMAAKKGGPKRWTPRYLKAPR